MKHHGSDHMHPKEEKHVSQLVNEPDLLKHLREPKKLLSDVGELCLMIDRFQMMYGINLKITYEK